MPLIIDNHQGIEPKSVRFAIDRGGTFTDVWASVPGRPDIVLKSLSVDPQNYADAPAEGIRRVLESLTGQELPRGQPIPKQHIHSIRMGTTVATNALLERKGTRHAFLVTEGWRDTLDLCFQSRPKLFELGIKKPQLLYDEVVEISERITPERFDEDPARESWTALEEIPGESVKGSTGDFLRVSKPLQEDEVRTKLLCLRDSGFDALAICFAHSYLYPDHEVKVAQIAAELGFNHISVSSAVGANMAKMVARGSSASADAYSTPEIKKYVSGFASGFEGGNLDGVQCEFMQSDGGLVSHKNFSGSRGILSGPAGGVVGYARTSFDGKTPLVGFDMGGTSTDVSRFGGDSEHVFETTTAGVVIQSPQLDVNTVAAGGGSILFWDNGLFKAGPASAGAHPGPASYRKGGPLTITDANLYLGRLIPERFPAIFGPNEDLPSDYEGVAKRFEELSSQINADTGRNMTPSEVAYGFIDVANESMSRPIRALTEARGFDTRTHQLASFGGAGGQHACELAHKLGMTRVVIHKHSSILSAYGMALAEVVQEAQEPSSESLTSDALPRIQGRIASLKERATQGSLSQGVDAADIVLEPYSDLRYQGTETNFMVKEPEDSDYKGTLQATHLRESSFSFPDDKPIMIDNIRVRGVGRSGNVTSDNEVLIREMNESANSTLEAQKEVQTSQVYFAGTGLCPTKVFLSGNLSTCTVVTGPASIIDKTQTIVVTPNASARILSAHVVVDLAAPTSKVAQELDTSSVDPIKLSIFAHRFMSIAEQMGRTLQKTSVSLNIKERLDFSCAIFSPAGELVANAPHVPVHLGSMSYAVRYQHELHRGASKPGDVSVSNHPESGGTHLPDITVITPVFESDDKTICFYTASRGHHMDIGGWKGTSMPPDSTELWQEGAAIKSFFLVKNNQLNEDGICELLSEPGKYRGCTGSRRLGDNSSDLKAQIAANTRGSSSIRALIDEYSKPVVHFYMEKIQQNAELAVRNYLKDTSARLGSEPLVAEDYSDNGSKMKVKISIDGDGTASFDFTGTSCEMYSNMNAPPAITYSALIYTLRLSIGRDIPLNQGCSGPTKVYIPKGTFSNPSEGPAVCCGNTLTSQRSVDLLLKAFSAAAGSQGCMNCFGFFGGGDEKAGFGFNYGETICGGEGATPISNGASGVHTHMTNTRTTDVEILEKRYPIILREFSIRKGSGGRGKFNGGCGIVRDWECRVPLTFTMISERRVHRPYGMEGGEPGEAGASYRVRPLPNGTYRWLSIGSRGQVDSQPGDRFVVHTPGGGAWGSPVSEPQTDGHAPTKAENGLVKAIGKFAQEQYVRATGSIQAYADSQAASS